MSDPRGESTVKSSSQPSSPTPGPKPGASRQIPPLAEAKAAGSNLMFFAYRDFTGAADVILAELGLGRAHHRALHFIGRNPGIPVTELLGILRITKQSLARVLTVLVEQGYVAQAQGQDDRRQRPLTLTAQGEALERRLFARQRERLSAAYRDAGGQAVDGFRRVMRSVMNEAGRAYIDRAEAAAHDGRPRQDRGD
jgi:DNA-binding MarR family transcriptional regulator